MSRQLLNMSVLIADQVAVVSVFLVSGPSLLSPPYCSVVYDECACACVCSLMVQLHMLSTREQRCAIRLKIVGLWLLFFFHALLQKFAPPVRLLVWSQETLSIAFRFHQSERSSPVFLHFVRFPPQNFVPLHYILLMSCSSCFTGNNPPGSARQQCLRS